MMSEARGCHVIEPHLAEATWMLIEWKEFIANYVHEIDMDTLC
jgi:hypothetical protein